MAIGDRMNRWIMVKHTRAVCFKGGKPWAENFLKRSKRTRIAETEKNRNVASAGMYRNFGSKRRGAYEFKSLKIADAALLLGAAHMIKFFFKEC